MAGHISPLDSIAIVLVRPRVAENIGAAARVAYNMGINQLIVVSNAMPAREPMAKMATHNAAHIVDNITLFSTLEEALSEFSLVVGTTARRGRHRFVQQTVRQMVAKLVPQITNNKVAILFGPEDAGLTNDDLKFCHMTSAIPTAEFSSLNLAQAVAIHCYELHYAIIHSQEAPVPSPERATTFELESMYSHLEGSLTRINFIDEISHDHWMSNIRNLFARLKFTAKDANIIRGICKKFNKHQDNMK
ncbi:MAG: tRNA methyltransferase [Desulfotalea sp.]|nr:MAG: tRNA methyltransferase [Desulfotalea sp.]